jgi:UDP-N-acetylmuramate dehydrogenase
MKILSNQYLSNYTTIRLGSLVRWFFKVENTQDLVDSIRFCYQSQIPFFILAGGSNTVFDDNINTRQAIIHTTGWNKVKVVENPKINSSESNPPKIKDFDPLYQEGNINKVILECDPGASLQSIIDLAQKNNLVGITGMNRIPGTIGGAVVGNAGAYGCEICNSVLAVEALRLSDIQSSNLYSNSNSNWNSDSTCHPELVSGSKKVIKTTKLSNQDCQFSYRNSLFKQDLDLVVTKIYLKLKKVSPKEFKPEIQKYKEIAILRDKVYPKGLASPGSLFKNLLYTDLTPESKELVPKEWVMYGNKVPVGKLLESLQVQGYRIGNITQRTTHANIMINLGGGKSSQARQIVKDLQSKVYNKYKIKIEPEVRFIPKDFGEFYSGVKVENRDIFKYFGKFEVDEEVLQFEKTLLKSKKGYNSKDTLF